MTVRGTADHSIVTIAGVGSRVTANARAMYGVTPDQRGQVK